MMGRYSSPIPPYPHGATMLRDIAQHWLVPSRHHRLLLPFGDTVPALIVLFRGLRCPAVQYMLIG
jgi:hypothetical protein